MKAKKEDFKFFNEEWNREDWEDNVDELDHRENKRKTVEED